MNLVIQVILVIFRNLMILVNMVISGIFIYSCESDRSGDSGAYGHPCDSGAGESVILVTLVIMLILVNQVILGNLALLVIQAMMVNFVISVGLVILVIFRILRFKPLSNCGGRGNSTFAQMLWGNFFWKEFA